MSAGTVGYSAPSSAQLQPGVEQRSTYNQIGGANGTQFYYDGHAYADPESANAAARAVADKAVASASGTNINSGSGGIVNTGGAMPSSYSGLVSATGSSTGGSGGGGGAGGGGVYVPNPDGSGPLLTQGGYESERSQNSSQAASAAQQAAQIKAASEAAAAADAAKRGDMELAAKLQAQAEKTRMDMFTSMSATPAAPHVDGGNIAADETQARAAAFARAKEQAGQTALSSLKALHDVMGDSGRMGSSAEASGEAGIIGGAGSDINDFTRDSYINDTNRAAAISDRNYAGDITQRGQDMQRLQSMMALITAGGGSVGAY